MVSEKKSFEIVDGRTMDDGQADDGRTEHGHPISSPCEPNGSGELIMGKRKCFNCIYCANKVTGRQHAVQCDGCGEWQHCKCNTDKELSNTKTHSPSNIQIFFQQ